MRVANRHAAALRARGAREAGGGHYPLMVALHAAFLWSCFLEAWFLRRPLVPWLAAMALVALLLAQGLRYWTIRTLGERWTTRVLVVPGSSVVTGYFDGVAVFGAREARETTLVSHAPSMFIARYAANGTLEWALGATGHVSYGYAIAAHDDGSCVVTGHFYSTNNFGGSVTLTGPFTYATMFVAPYAANGALVWAEIGMTAVVIQHAAERSDAEHYR